MYIRDTSSLELLCTATALLAFLPSVPSSTFLHFYVHYMLSFYFTRNFARLYLDQAVCVQLRNFFLPQVDSNT